MDIIELKYFWCNDKLFGAKSEWRKMYFAIENFINLLEMTGEEWDPYRPKGKYYSLNYTFGEKGKTVFIDKNSAKLLADKLGFNLRYSNQRCKQNGEDLNDKFRTHA